MLNYDMPLYRPPSEGNNLIVQATLGCSFNQCSFCSMYKTKEYRPRPLNDVFANIDQAQRMWPDAHRVFLADGDALTLPTGDLLAICQKLRGSFPALQRISAYATPINLIKKSEDDLQMLKDAKLSLVYLGIESGSNNILKRITKGATQASIAKAINKVRDNGLKVSAMLILGLGGKAHWEEHIKGSAELINMAPPNYLSTLQLYLEDIVVDEFMTKYGEPFEFQNDSAILTEQEQLLAQVNPPKPIIFRSNHASNCLALAGNLPRDKDRLLDQIHAAQSGETPLRPEFIRGL